MYLAIVMVDTLLHSPSPQTLLGWLCLSVRFSCARNRIELLETAHRADGGSFYYYIKCNIHIVKSNSFPVSVAAGRAEREIDPSFGSPSC